MQKFVKKNKSLSENCFFLYNNDSDKNFVEVSKKNICLQ